LTLLSCFYYLAIRFRSLAYRCGLLRAKKLSCPVISVGNITAGGTGKTPLVEAIARWLRDRGVKVAIVSRGYAAEKTGKGVSDEFLLLRENLPDVPHITGANRWEAGKQAIERHSAECLVLDDGFQHLALSRDLDLVVIDTTNPFGYGYLLPRGLLREPVSGIGRADLLLLSRRELCPPQRLQGLKEVLARLNPDAQVVEMEHEITELRRFDGGEGLAPEWLQGRKVYAFCGIGNPPAFELGLKRLGASLVGSCAFPDHHRYREPEIEELILAARDFGAEALVTTQKDRVKIGRYSGGVPLLTAVVRAKLTEGREVLEARLQKLLETAGPPEDSGPGKNGDGDGGISRG
jgi:tetraacyldisaccharide 4'-kinase